MSDIFDTITQISAEIERQDLADRRFHRRFVIVVLSTSALTLLFLILTAIKLFFA